MRIGSDLSALYVDASALIKLVIEEPESAAVRLATAPASLYASIVLRVEVGLAARRELGQAGVKAARDVLATVAMLWLSEELLDAASRMSGLRALDAIHLATALTLREQIDGLVTYDQRLSEAATAAGLRVVSPA